MPWFILHLKIIHPDGGFNKKETCVEVTLRSSFVSTHFLSANRISACKLLFTPLLCCIMHLTLDAQVIQGKVVDAATQEPLPYASIFLEGTLIGTITDTLGNFELDTKGNTSNPLVISFIGYQALIFPVADFNAHPIIQLYAKPELLEEINVNQFPGSWSREKMLRRFKNELLGTSVYASSCKILNENDIYLFYNDSSQVLHGRAKKPLMIINRMLGYRITYLLESFRTGEEGTKYKGYHNFEELEPDISNLKKRIIKNREEAYVGSVMHFMRSLYRDNVHADDTIFEIKINSTRELYIEATFQIHSETTPKNVYDPSNIDTLLRYFNTPERVVGDSWMNQFHLNDSAGNYVTKRQILIERENSRWLCFQGKLRIIYYPKFMSSYMVPLADSIEIWKNGYYNPDLIRWQGSMTRKRVGDLLPYDYQLE